MAPLITPLFEAGKSDKHYYVICNLTHVRQHTGILTSLMLILTMLSSFSCTGTARDASS